jgi:hypothetical protein
MGEPGFAEVYLVVDNAGQEVEAVGIDHLGPIWYGRLIAVHEYQFNQAVVDIGASTEHHAFIHDNGILDVIALLHKAKLQNQCNYIFMSETK